MINESSLLIILFYQRSSLGTFVGHSSMGIDNPTIHNIIFKIVKKCD